jgi:peptidoglycan/LPS O-acetylase OafA/YrhL
MSFAPQRAYAFAYRPDIDGLRALAVLAVILFHADVAGFRGGYVGVDVFFVISGYLITQLLRATSVHGARHMLGTFYARRARRILPALLATCAAVAVLGWLLFTPPELIRLGRQLTAAPLFLSNLAAWSEAGDYFARAFPWTPLRHLWSIAVEEQFYLLYPLVVLAIERYLPQRQARVLSVLALASLLLCVWASYYRPGVNYFALPTRAWELLLGGVLALKEVAPGSRVWRETAAVSALVVLGATVWLYNPYRIAYPGVYTLLPCAATLTLLAAGTGTGSVVNRLLAWRPLVFVGLISYSLYLWHLPLLTFAAYCSLTPLSTLERAGVIGATFALAALSWRLIEQPVRQRVLFRSRRGLLLGASTASVLVLSVGCLLWRSDGFPQRFPAPERAFLIAPDFASVAGCLRLSPAQIRAGHLCRAGPAGAGPSAVLWGDSHALALLPAVEELSARHHMALYFAVQYTCWPLLGGLDRAGNAESQARCAAFNDAVADFVRELKPRLVILGGRWDDRYFEAAPDLRVADPERAFTAVMRHTAQGLRGAGAICVVFDVPHLKYAVPHALLIAHRRGMNDGFLAITHEEALAPLQQMEAQVRELAQTGVLRFADPKSLLCPGSTCLYKLDGQPLYSDEDHLSPAGAAYSAPALEACFDPPQRAPADAGE